MHVITRMIVGGAQENTLLSCTRLDSNRFESVLITGPETGSEGSLLTEVEAAGVRTIIEPSLRRAISPRYDVSAFIRLRQVLERESPDVVHTHSSKAGIIGRLAARTKRMPAIVHTVHGWSFHEEMPAPTRQAYVAAERACARLTDRLIVVTDLDREKGLDAHIGNPDQYRLVRSGFDTEPFLAAQATRADARRELGIEGDTPLVGSVMRLSAQKDPVTWIRAAALVAQMHEDARFAIIGDGPLRQRTEQEVAAAGLRDRVLLLGVRRDVPRLLSAFDAFLLTSRWEGLPKVVVQAMASAVPVVATASDGVKEAVRPERTGLIVPVGDTGGAATAIHRALVDRSLRQSLIDNGLAYAQEFDTARMIENLTDVYDEVLAISR